MIARGSGRILNLASTAAFIPGPTQAVYFATKAYVLSLTEALAVEFNISGERPVHVLGGVVESQHLFDRTGHQRKISNHLVALLGVPRQKFDGIGDHFSGRLVAGYHEQDAEPEKFLIGESPTIDFGLNEVVDQPLAVAPTTTGQVVDEVLEQPKHSVERFLWHFHHAVVADQNAVGVVAQFVTIGLRYS